MSNPSRTYLEPVITLREYIDMRFSEDERHRQQAGQVFLEYNARERASMEKRLEGMNEFRQQLNSQAATFATREAVSLYNDALERRVRTLEQFQANIIGRITAIGGALLFASIGVQVLLHFL